MEVLRMKTGRRTQLLDVTEQVERAVAAAGVLSGVCYLYVPHTTAGVLSGVCYLYVPHTTAGVLSGVCYLYVPHTTAGVMINEHFDPDVATDLEGVFERLVPRSGPYRHSEGNSDSHAKALLTGSSQMIFVEQGKLVLGQWQGVFFCEFDGPRERKMWVRVMGDAQ